MDRLGIIHGAMFGAGEAVVKVEYIQEEKGKYEWQHWDG